MFTIKIVTTSGLGITKLYGGNTPSYFKVKYSNKKDFMDYLRKFEKDSPRVDYLFTDPEDDYSYHDDTFKMPKEGAEQPTAGEFVHMTLCDYEDLWMDFVIKGAVVYIMQDGKTVDTIYC